MGIKYLYTEDVNGMTIQNLYSMCDNINFFLTKVFIMDAERNILVWNKMLSAVSDNLLQLEVECFKIIGDEVLIWVP
jgi:hypothetical protein